jgi:hypothetical protein
LYRCDEGVCLRVFCRFSADRKAHQAKLISPQFVRPFVKAKKTTSSMRFVSPKIEEQQTFSVLHRRRFSR